MIIKPFGVQMQSLLMVGALTQDMSNLFDEEIVALNSSQTNKEVFTD